MTLQRRSGGVATALTGRKVRRAGAPVAVSKLWKRSGGTAVLVADWSGAGTPPTLYSDTFGASIGTWAAASNASGVARDTTRYADGALTWTATAGGAASQVASNGNALTVLPNTNYRVQLKVSHNAAAPRGFNGGVDVFTSGGGYLASSYSGYTTVVAGASSVTLTKDFTTGATAGLVRFQALFVDPVAAGERAYLDEAMLLGPL